MAKEDNGKRAILNLLAEEPTMVLSTAYVYAKNYVDYGEDITKAWTTAVQQSSIIQEVRQKAWVEVYDSFKADYEARLRADMLAMLEELKEQLREMHEDFFETEHFDEAYGVSNSMDIIQQKINTCKQKPTTKNELVYNLCDSCTNIGCEFQSGIIRTKCTFYMPPQLESDNCGNYVVQGPITKNDLAVNVPDNNVGDMDCISRAGAIKAIQKYGVGCLDADDFSPEGCERFVINKLNELPSVTPQTRKGHWIPVFQGDEIIDYRCSCCEFGNTFGKGTVGMNYCPRCGSRNEVEE